MSRKKFKYVYCKSGFGVSVQASSGSYCTPRDNLGPYSTVELGFPSASDELIIGFADDKDSPTETVYGYVPVGLVQALLIKHGGVIEGDLPVFQMNEEQAAILAIALCDHSNTKHENL